MGLIDELPGGRVGLDTSLFIYLIEEHPAYLPVVEPVFAAVDRGRLEGVTSAVTLLEVLVVPYRSGNEVLAKRYEAFLSRSRGLRMVEVNHGQLRAAARLRAALGLKTPDALQVSAALGADCTCLLTNDDRWPERVAGLPIVQLARYVG